MRSTITPSHPSDAPQELKEVPLDPEAVDIRDRIWLASNTPQRLIAHIPAPPPPAAPAAAAAAAAAATAMPPTASQGAEASEASLQAESGVWLGGGGQRQQQPSSSAASSQSSRRASAGGAGEGVGGPLLPTGAAAGCSTQQRVVVAEVLAGLTWTQLGGYQPTPPPHPCPSPPDHPLPPLRGHRTLRRMAVSELELDADVRDVINPRLLPHNQQRCVRECFLHAFGKIPPPAVPAPLVYQ
jgi:hypothetical protein